MERKRGASLNLGTGDAAASSCCRRHCGAASAERRIDHKNQVSAAALLGASSECGRVGPGSRGWPGALCS
eukprot:5016651-Pleurochrysis_carterae.AAC.1